MKRYFGLEVAYFVVATAFTWVLLGSILAAVDFIFPSGNVQSKENNIEVIVEHLIKERKITQIVEQGPEKYFETYVFDSVTREKRLKSIQRRHVLDTLSKSNSNDDFPLLFLSDPTVKLPVYFFKKSNIVLYHYIRIRSLFLIVIWALLLYQIFLVLYDLRRAVIFSEKNVSRMRRVGFMFLALFVLQNFKDTYYGVLSPEGHLLLLDKKHILLMNISYLYLIVGLIFFGLSQVFVAGKRVQTEIEH